MFGLRFLPKTQGAGGGLVREPTKREMAHFLKLLDKVPSSYFSSIKEPSHPDYGDRYTDVIMVEQWLNLLVTANILKD